MEDIIHSLAEAQRLMAANVRRLPQDMEKLAGNVEKLAGNMERMASQMEKIIDIQRAQHEQIQLQHEQIKVYQAKLDELSQFKQDSDQRFEVLLAEMRYISQQQSQPSKSDTPKTDG